MFQFLKNLVRPKSPEYKRFLLIGRSTCAYVWEAKVWNKLKVPLDRLVSEATGPTELSVHLLDATRKGPIEESTFLWGSRKMDSWVQKGDSKNREQLHRLDFVDLRIYCPGTRHLEKTGTWADLFLHVVRPYSKYWTQVCHIAVGEHFLDRSEIKELLGILIAEIEPVFFATRESPWLEKNRSKSLDAFLTVGFNYRGGHEHLKPDLARLEGDWQELPIP